MHMKLLKGLSACNRGKEEIKTYLKRISALAYLDTENGYDRGFELGR